MNKAARTLAVGAAVAALALTGCANSPSDAATVEGVRIADSQVRQVAQALTDGRGMEPSMALKQATYDLLLGEASRQVAASTGTVVSAADQAELVGQYQALAAVADNPAAAPWVDAVTRSFLIGDQLGGEKYTEEILKLDVTVNPRYGKWDPLNGPITDASLARLVDPTTLRR